MQDDEFEIGHHAVLVQRRVGACQIDLSRIRHFVNNLVEDQVHAMICLEPQLDGYEETLLRNDRVNHIFAGERIVDGIHVYEPVNVRAFRALLKHGVNDIRIDVAFAVRHREVHEVGRFLWNSLVSLQILYHSNVVFQIHKLCMSRPQFSRVQKDIHHDKEKSCDSKCEPASVREFAEVGNKECTLNCEQQDPEHDRAEG